MKLCGKVLYVTSKGVFVGCESDRLYTRKNGDKQYYNAISIDYIYLNQSSSISCGAVLLCNKYDINILITDHNAKKISYIEGEKNKNIFIRKNQVLISSSEAARIKIARHIVSRKIESMHDESQNDEILSFRDKVEEEMDYQKILGLEGMASKIYFSYVRKKFLNHSFTFKRRSFHPALDPANSLLSLCYSLVFAETLKSVRLFGFDSAFGFLHKDYYGRNSLVCDIMEPFRSKIGDNYAFYCIDKLALIESDFVFKGQGYYFESSEKLSSFYKNFRESFFSESMLEDINDFTREIYDLVTEDVNGIVAA